MWIFVYIDQQLENSAGWIQEPVLFAILERLTNSILKLLTVIDLRSMSQK